MFFKSGPGLAAILMLGMGIGGCSLRTGEPAIDNSVLDLGARETGCLDGASEKVDRYFDGKSDRATMDALFRCFSRSLELFSENMRGKEQGSFHPSELRDFLQRYFVKRKNLSDKLRDQAMNLKTALLGGDASRVTLSELDRARYLVEVARVQALELLPYLPLSVTSLNKRHPERFEESMAAFHSSSAALGKALQEVDAPYRFAHFEFLLEALEPLFDARIRVNKDGEIEKVNSPRDMRLRILPIIRATKPVLLGTSDQAIGGREWPEIMDTTARAYAVYARFDYLWDNYKERSLGGPREMLFRSYREFRALLIEAVESHADGVIPFEEVEALVESFKRETFPIREDISKRLVFRRRIEVQRDTLLDLIRPGIQRMVGGLQEGAEGRDAKGLTLAAIERGWQSVERWHEAERILEAAFRRAMRRQSIPEETPVTEVELSFADLFSGNDAKAEILAEAGELKHSESVYRELMQTVARARPMLHGQDMEILFSSRRPRKFSFHDISELNWMKQFVRLVMPGYLTSPSPDIEIESIGLTVEEVRRFVDDVLQLGIDLRSIDKRRAVGVHARRFREANLFTYASDGNSVIDLDETTQLFAFLSSTKRMANRMHEEIAKICNATELDEYYMQPIVSRSCYLRALFAPRKKLDGTETTGFEIFLVKMPEMAAYYRDLVRQGKNGEFEAAIERAMRGLNTSPVFDLADSESIAGVLHYIEGIFQRFDLDRTGTIEIKEADKAFSVFKGTISEVGQSVVRRMIEDMYGRSGIEDRLKDEGWKDKANEIKETIKQLTIDLQISSDEDLKHLFYYLLAHGDSPGLDWPKWRMLPDKKFAADRGVIAKIFAEITAETSVAPQPSGASPESSPLE